jgi:NTE family protein
MRFLSVAFSLFVVAGCSLNAYQNRKLEGEKEYRGKASLLIRTEKKPGTLVLLALSGGGSRAAYFSASAMFRLREVFRGLLGPDFDFLKQVDAISSVSGGSLAAAYFCLSRDPEDQASQSLKGHPVWSEKEVKALMSKNFLMHWLGRWFWPQNIARYWFTAFDRTDIMAQTFAATLFSGPLPLQSPYHLRDLNPARPYLILNATDGTENTAGDEHFGKGFTFTHEDFRDRLQSDISRYQVANAVMASAAFPAAFNYLTLKNFKASNQYLHVFDGGNSDNLGLKGLERALLLSGKHYDHLVVILIDSFVPHQGIDRNRYDARGFFSYFIDSNFLDTYDSLLYSNRAATIEESRVILAQHAGELVFLHLRLDEDQEKAVQAIPTSFRISSEGVASLDKAVRNVLPRPDLSDGRPRSQDYLKDYLEKLRRIAELLAPEQR